MRAVFALLPGLLLFAGLVEARDEAPVYSQSYVILIKGAVAGRETVTERIGDGGKTIATSEHEIFITDGLEIKRILLKDSRMGL